MVQQQQAEQRNNITCLSIYSSHIQLKLAEYFVRAYKSPRLKDLEEQAIQQGSKVMHNQVEVIMHLVKGHAD